VEIGTNAKGRVVTTCVAVTAEPPARKGPAEKLTSGQKVALDCLGTALAEKGRTPPPARDIPASVKAVSYEEWQETALRYLPGESDRRKREAFQRKAEALQAKGLVKHAAGFCWIPAS
jgi:hypothetical protein